jgi:ABC-type multidrug transport system ATPase subunit
MAHNPGLLILDEPTAGVAPSGQIEIRQLILDMAHEEGKTVFLSSHNLDEVERICNRIALIDRGEIKLYGELEQLQREMSTGEVDIETTEAIAEPLFAELKSLSHSDYGSFLSSASRSSYRLSFSSATAVYPHFTDGSSQPDYQSCYRSDNCYNYWGNFAASGKSAWRAHNLAAGFMGLGLVYLSRRSPS